MKIRDYVDGIYEYSSRVGSQIVMAGKGPRTWMIRHFLENLEENAKSIEHNNKMFQKYYNSRFNSGRDFLVRKYYGSNLSDLCILAENTKKVLLNIYSPKEEIIEVGEKYRKVGLEKYLIRLQEGREPLTNEAVVRRTEFLGYYFDKKRLTQLDRNIVPEINGENIIDLFCRIHRYGEDNAQVKNQRNLHSHEGDRELLSSIKRNYYALFPLWDGERIMNASEQIDFESKQYLGMTGDILSSMVNSGETAFARKMDNFDYALGKATVLSRRFPSFISTPIVYKILLKREFQKMLRDVGQEKKKFNKGFGWMKHLIPKEYELDNVVDRKE